MKQVNLRIYRMILPLLMGLFLSVGVYAQNITVKGHVKDAMGEVIGANVVEKGNTSNGTITDLDGNFTLSVPKGATLVVSFIGYQTQEVAAAPSVIITLKDDAELLSEVVVIGYGRAKKNDLTGSVTAIKPDEMNKGLQVSAQDMITGKIAGVNVQNSGGEPGGGASIRIRGGSSLNASNDPLIVIDGLAMDNYGMQGMSNPLNLVNPNDIESFTVLKDASATAIYGSRASNGVIIITTKKGRKNMKPTISYNGNVSVSTVTNKLDVLSANEFMNFIKNKSGLEGADWEASDYYKNMGYWSAYNADGTPADGAQHLFADTDWQDEATRTAISHNHQLNVQQGGEKSSMGAFLNYTDNQGIMLNTYSKRLNAKIAYDANPTTWLSTAINLAVNHTWGNSTPEDGGGQDARRTMIEMVPWMPVQYNGKYTSTNTPEGMPMDFEAMSNPVHILKTYKNMNYNTKVFGNAALTFHIIEGLDLKTQFGVDANFKTLHKYMPSDLVNLAYDQHGRAERYHANTLYWQEETYLTYNKTIGEHRINAMAGLSWQERKYDYSRMYTENFTTDFFEDFNMDAGTKPDAPKTYWERWAMNSYFLRFAYTFKDRYSATITGRYDGSSKFGKNNKYAFFPSAGLAWNITQEDFMSDQNTISNLKLHTSYGLTGNSEIGVYKSLATVKSETLLLNGTRNSYSYLNRLPNSDLKWEKTAQFDIGFDLGLFNNRITLDASYYNKKTSDLLLDAPVPHTTGFETVYKNIGSIRNQGLDLMLSTRNIDTKDFTWTTSINANFNKNKILSLGDNDEDILKNEWVSGASILRVGESVGSFYGYKRLGVYTIEDYEAGNCQKKQIGRAKRSSEREIIGKGVPDWTGSMINTLRYKNWDFTLDLQFVAGVQTLQQFYHSTYDRFGQTNGLTNILYDAYNGTNPNSMQQAIWLFNGGHAGQDTLTDSQWVANGSYLRANLIQLGYTFDSNQLAKTPFSSLRLYLNVNNAFLITAKDFNGYDPESTSQISTSNGSVSPEQFGQNMAFFSYPRARTFTLGVNVTF